MTTVTQRIDNFFLGISQQPDNRKRPGQLRDSVNTLPDYASGLLKRPGGKFINTLNNADPNETKWFPIIRDSEEKYVGQIDFGSNRIRVWDVQTGTEQIVDQSFGLQPSGLNCFYINTVVKTSDPGGLLANTLYSNVPTGTNGTGNNLTLDLLTDGSGNIDTATINNQGNAGYQDGDLITVFSLYPTGFSANFTYKVGLKRKKDEYVAAREVTEAALASLQSASATYQEKVAAIEPTLLFEVGYNYTTSVSEYLKSGALLDGNGLYTVKQDDNILYLGTVTPSLATPVLNGGSGYGPNDGEYTNVATSIDPYLTILTSQGIGVVDGTYTNVGTTTNGNGTNLGVDITISNGHVTEATINSGNPGSNYSTGDLIFVNGAPGVRLVYKAPAGLTVDIIVTSGAITRVLPNPTTMETYGSLYDVGNVLSISGGTAGTCTVNTVSLNVEVTEEHPLLGSQGVRIYKVSLTDTTPAETAAIVAAEAAMDAAQTAYDTAVTDEDAAFTAFDSYSDSKCFVSSWNNYFTFSQSTVEDIEVLNVNDFTFLLNKNYTTGLGATKSAAEENHAFVVVKAAGHGTYTVRLDGNAITYNAGSNDDVRSIAEGLTNAIHQQTFNSLFYNAAAVNGGIYLETTAPFQIEAFGGPFSDSIYAFRNSIQSANNLPLECWNGYKVKVVNSTTTDADDLYVKFVTNNNATYGNGVWEETLGFDLKHEMVGSNLPHQLVRRTDGVFELQECNWVDRLVGDDTTNPVPSFIGKKIDHIFFYRNRLGFLSGDTINLSKAGDYFNFFGTTAMTVTDDDPIDILVSATKPVKLTDVHATSAGLVLFSDREQFLLTAPDQQSLTPTTARIEELSSFEYSKDAGVASLGTNLVFTSQTPLYTRVYEMFGIKPTDPPNLIDQTLGVPELLPKSINSLTTSGDLSMVSFGTRGEKTLYQYKFFNQGQERSPISWQKWELCGDLLLQFFDQNQFYAVTTDGTQVFLQSYDISQKGEEGFLNIATGQTSDVCLDNWVVNPPVAYPFADAQGNNVDSRIYLPYDNITGKTLYVVLLGNIIGQGLSSVSTGEIETPTVQGSAGSQYIQVFGDYRGKDIAIGFGYNMEVTFPEFYYRSGDGQAQLVDYTADLIMHRMKFSTGLSGPIKYQVDITGRPEWSNTVEPTLPYGATYNEIHMTENEVHIVPVYQRTENLSVKAIADQPLPASLFSVNWEGRYNNGFYNRR